MQRGVLTVWQSLDIQLIFSIIFSQLDVPVTKISQIVNFSMKQVDLEKEVHHVPTLKSPNYQYMAYVSLVSSYKLCMFTSANLKFNFFFHLEKTASKIISLHKTGPIFPESNIISIMNLLCSIFPQKIPNINSRSDCSDMKYLLFHSLLYLFLEPIHQDKRNVDNMYLCVLFF